MQAPPYPPRHTPKNQTQIGVVAPPPPFFPHMGIYHGTTSLGTFARRRPPNKRERRTEEEFPIIGTTTTGETKVWWCWGGMSRLYYILGSIYSERTKDLFLRANYWLRIAITETFS